MGQELNLTASRTSMVRLPTKVTSMSRVSCWVNPASGRRAQHARDHAR